MRIHHLSCTKFFLGARGVTHCLVVETDHDGLVLVDTGLGKADYERPRWRVRFLIAVNRVPCNSRETATGQVARLGYRPEDVRHIVLTHMQSDRSGRLTDLPRAKVHVYAKEYEAAMHPRRLSFLYLVGMESSHWAHGPKCVNHPEPQRRWLGLNCIPVR